MKDFRNLSVWEKSHTLVLKLYRILADFPGYEQYGLISQLRRAVVSIPTNIAEGCGRGSDKDFKRFVQIAMGSASEVEYLLLVSKDLGYVTQETYKELNGEIVEIKKMLASLITKLCA